jgi:hypothetical protein
MNLEIKILKLGNSYLAFTTLGGIHLKGARADTELRAVRNLFFAIGEGSSEDHQIGLELALEGTTLKEAMGELAPGEVQQ